VSVRGRAAFVVGLGVRFIMIGGILGGRFALPRDAAMTEEERGPVTIFKWLNMSPYY
jgi:hypothetical protein